MADNMDTPISIDNNDPRYIPAMARIATICEGRDIAQILILMGGLREARQIVADCRQLCAEADEIIFEIGDMELGVKVGELAQVIDERLSELDERIARESEGE